MKKMESGIVPPLPEAQPEPANSVDALAPQSASAPTTARDVSGTFVPGLSPAPGKDPCSARLALRFADDTGTTRLVDNRHFGPLRVQKALYPETPAVCHAIIVHPPGGVVGGDRLDIAVSVEAGAQALLTTPGATKWYRANGAVSRQDMSLIAAAGATIEWLPQETIFFNGAHVELDTRIDLAAGARYIGCETLCFGRTASGERFDHGKVSQRLSIKMNGKLAWYEQGLLLGDGAGMQSVLTLAGKTVCSTLVAVAPTFPPGLLAALRERLSSEFGPAAKASAQTGANIDAHASGATDGNGSSGASKAPMTSPLPLTAPFALTQMKSVLVARYLGDSSETARLFMTRVWQLLRPAMLGREAVVPRIWLT